MNLNKNRFNLSKNSRTPPLEIRLKRNSIIESIHRAHAVVCDNKGRILMKAGSADYETFIRSALKPFQLIPFLSSGTAEHIQVGEKGLAICCSSHAGTTMHAREAFRVLWNADIAVDLLQCPIPKNGESPLEHNCSGKHAAFLATCKKMGWPLESYLSGEHPLQKEILRVVSSLLSIPKEELVMARDDCGAPTFSLQISQMALLYAHLSESRDAETEQIARAMLSYPELIAGKGLFDSELMLLGHGQVISKGGAEGIQCLSRTGEGIGVAIKVEDGSKRAKHAVALHLLKQLDWLTPSGLKELEEQFLLLDSGLKLEVKGKLGFSES